MKLVFIILLGAIHLASPTQKSFRRNKPDPIWLDEIIEQRLRWTESEFKSYATSPAGAIGQYQITPICLKHYNDFHRRKFVIEEMRIRWKARYVYRWYIKYLYRHYSKSYSDEDILSVLVINSYNMGLGNTKKGKFNYDYCASIVPEELSTFLERYDHYSYTYRENKYFNLKKDLRGHL